MLVLCLEKELEASLTALARASGRSKSDAVREAIVRLIEEAEDLELAEKALRITRSTKSLRQLKKELGPER